MTDGTRDRYRFNGDVGIGYRWEGCYLPSVPSDPLVVNLDINLSFKKFPKKYNRATPTHLQKYMTAFASCDLIKKEIPEEDWTNLQFNIKNDRQNTRLSFRQITNSSVELTVCQTGSSQLQMRLTNNGSM